MENEKRRFERSPFKPGTWVKLKQNAEGAYPKSYLIIDISVAGLGLISMSESEIKKNDEYFVIDVDGIPLPKQVKLVTIYVEPIPGPEVRFRVGCEFTEATDIFMKK